MSTIEERSEYLNNPYFTKHIYGDFTAFYVTIGICSVFLAVLILVNILFGCCSKYKDYWQDRHTGNRFLVSLWTSTAHKQPPLDLHELEGVKSFHPRTVKIFFKLFSIVRFLYVFICLCCL